MKMGILAYGRFAVGSIDWLDVVAILLKIVASVRITKPSSALQSACTDNRKIR